MKPLVTAPPSFFERLIDRYFPPARRLVQAIEDFDAEHATLQRQRAVAGRRSYHRVR